MVDLLKNYDFSKQRRLSFEYIVFKGVNDSLLYAKELLKLLRGLDCRINLSPLHAIPGVDLEGADMETMTKLRDYLTSHGCLLRYVLPAVKIYLPLAACFPLPNRKRINKN